MTKTSIKTFIESGNSYYQYRLAVSSDTIAVLSNYNTLIEFIRHNIDNDAWVCVFPDEDAFLDCISVLCKLVDANLNIWDNVIRN